MILLGVAVHLPYQLILVLAFLIVAGHNLLDIPEAAENFKAGFWWDLLHHGQFAPYEFAPRYYLLIVYPFLPWTGLMLMGYCFGIFYSDKFSAMQRKKYLLMMGLGLIVFFALLRYLNFYGDPVDWAAHKTGFLSLLSFIRLNKYPPSLLYMCMTIGPALLFLAVIEKVKNGFTNKMVVFGRTAFFITFFIFTSYTCLQPLLFCKRRTQCAGCHKLYAKPALLIYHSRRGI